MDAFAVSVGKGLSMRRVNLRQCFLIALFFGGFQALMPWIGWNLGLTFAKYIDSIDHFIAFILLGYIGGKMIFEAWEMRKEDGKEDPEGEKQDSGKRDQTLRLTELFILAIATSIDALAVGVTFSFQQVRIYLAIAIIGVTTFCLSVAGVYVGNLFGRRYEVHAQLVGGVILVLIGVRILVQGLLGG